MHFDRRIYISGLLAAQASTPNLRIRKKGIVTIDPSRNLDKGVGICWFFN